MSKWKRCTGCEQTLLIPTYFGDSDKELEEIHTLPLGGQRRGDLLFQPLTGTLFFFPLSSFGSYLCFCYRIILLFFNKKVRMGFEQEETLLEKGPESVLTFVLKVSFREAVKRPHQAAPQSGSKGCNFPRAGFEHKNPQGSSFLLSSNS